MKVVVEIELVGGPKDGDRMDLKRPLPLSLQVQYMDRLHTYLRDPDSTKTIFRWTGYGS